MQGLKLVYKELIVRITNLIFWSAERCVREERFDRGANKRWEVCLLGLRRGFWLLSEVEVNCLVVGMAGGEAYCCVDKLRRCRHII